MKLLLRNNVVEVISISTNEFSENSNFEIKIDDHKIKSRFPYKLSTSSL